MDVEQSGRCCCSFLPRIHQAHDFFLLVGSELVASPPKPALLARFIQTAVLFDRAITWLLAHKVILPG